MQENEIGVNKDDQIKLDNNSVHHEMEWNNKIVCKDDCSSKGRLKRRVISNHHHWFPWIHEDYRGPYRHIPRHH